MDIYTLIGLCARMHLANRIVDGAVHCSYCEKPIEVNEMKVIAGGYMRHEKCHYAWRRELTRTSIIRNIPVLMVVFTCLLFGFQEGSVECNNMRSNPHPCHCARGTTCHDGKPAEPDESRNDPMTKCFNDCKKEACKCMIPCGS